MLFIASQNLSYNYNSGREFGGGCFYSAEYSGFGGLGIALLAFGTQVRVFKPDRSRRIFKGEKILSTPSCGGEVKPSVPCRRFTAGKRTLECIVEVGISRQNHRLSFSLTNSSTFRCLELLRRVICGETSDGKSGNS